MEWAIVTNLEIRRPADTQGNGILENKPGLPDRVNQWDAHCNAIILEVEAPQHSAVLTSRTGMHGGVWGGLAVACTVRSNLSDT
ncbi:hypothetical protein MJO28_002894 [Puccinia striiformis f. sp. tritici]|uniref:Uncharacterized protein n=1 Tax=Puccinia striiformis f. sp. tritici TaxID=168172 RepID=A0ACC0ESN9_9BASI|nr:hypothetical protein MJO28_002894 [Puccinia striiformis f. sp. tritici]KAI7964861.1 hypothetical protein MJO29_002959 [Puccinia striiformis f. sp. tritici]